MPDGMQKTKFLDLPAGRWFASHTHIPHTPAFSHNCHFSHTCQMDGLYVSLTRILAAGIQGITVFHNKIIGNKKKHK